MNKFAVAVFDGGRIKAAITAYEEVLAENRAVQEDDGAGIIVLLIYGNWARLSVEDMTLFGTLCAEDETIIKLLDPVKEKRVAVKCLGIYPPLVHERREQPKSRNMQEIFLPQILCPNIQRSNVNRRRLDMKSQVTNIS